MHPVKQKITALLAQAKGTRWDRVASRVCGLISLTAGFAPYAHLIPGRTGAIIAGVSGFCGMFLPRAQKAAGLLTAAYGQQTPLLKVLPEMIKTLLTASQITADAKAQASAQAAAQKSQENAALIQEAIDQIEARFKTGAYTPGSGSANLSQDVPDLLRSQPASDTAQTDENSTPQDATENR